MRQLFHNNRPSSSSLAFSAPVDNSSKQRNLSIFLIISLFLLIALLSETLLVRSREQARRAGFGCDFNLNAPHTSNRTVGTTYCVDHKPPTSAASALLHEHFPTNGNKKHFRFLVVGDFGRDGYCCQLDIALEMARIAQSIGEIQFVVNVGDSFYEYGLLSPTEEQVKTSFRDIYIKPYSSLQVPWYSVLGNHEYRGSAQAVLDMANKHDKHFTMPHRYYDHVIDTLPGAPTVHILYLDTSPMIAAYYKSGYDDGKDTMLKQRDGITSQDIKEQLKWFEQQLRESTADVRIVVSHHPPFTSGAHYMEDDKFLRNTITPLLEKYRVSLMLSGHDHTMQHYSKANVHYFISAAGSKVEAEFSRGDEYLRYYGKINGFLAVDVSKTVITVSVIDIKGEVIRTTLIKV